MGNLEYYKNRCKQLEEIVNELANKLWGVDIHLARKVSDIMDDNHEEPSQQEKKQTFEKSESSETINIDSL